MRVHLAGPIAPNLWSGDVYNRYLYGHVWMNRSAFVRAVFAWTCVAMPAVAQEIGVVSGRVSDDATSRPMVGAIVRLTPPPPYAMRTTRTDETGSFVFARVPLGAASLDVRRLGFGMVRRAVQVDTIGAPLAITMTRITQLDTIRVRAAKQGLFGVVASATDMRPLPNANVRLSGVGGGPLKIDSGGHFFVPIKSVGNYMLRASAPGFLMQTMSIIVSPNEGVEVALLLDSAVNGANHKLSHALADFDERIIQRGLASALVPRSEVLRNEDAALAWALRYSPSFARETLRLGDTACVFVDGNPKPGLSINDIDPAEVEAIEVYGTGRGGDRSGTLSRRWPRLAPCGDTGMPRTAPGVEVIRWVVIWLKH